MGRKGAEVKKSDNPNFLSLNHSLFLKILTARCTNISLRLSRVIIQPLGHANCQV